MRVVVDNIAHDRVYMGHRVLQPVHMPKLMQEDDVQGFLAVGVGGVYADLESVDPVPHVHKRGHRRGTGVCVSNSVEKKVA